MVYLDVAKRILYYLKSTIDLNLILEKCKKKVFDLVS